MKWCNMQTLLRILTPERVLYDNPIDQVTLPSASGEITVLPKHVGLVGILRPGELVIRSGAETVPLVVSGGMFQVRSHGITILADTAERIEEINEQRAEEARERAEQLLKEKKFDTEEYAAIAAKIEKELARIRVVRKHRKAQ